GETDVLKALQLLPGVKAGTEGTSGMYVRGGGPDENLFLLDGVPIYNVNHLGGFFSVFDADAIKNVTLYKGNFPARFGGRLSSVVDIRMKDGDNKKYHGNISVGLISSKFNIEGPIFNEKTTFNISARRTYFDLLLQPVLKIVAASQGTQDVSAGYYFYDMNAKISHKFSDKDRLFLSAYMGDDAVYSTMRQNFSNYEGTTNSDWLKMKMKWGNAITALRWNHIINNKLFMNTTATFTRYRYFVSVGTESEYKSPTEQNSSDITLGYNSGIVDYSGKVDFDYSPNSNNDMKFGVSLTNHTFRPGVQVLKMEANDNGVTQKMDTTIGDKDVFSNEAIVYVEDNISLGSFVKANVGLNYSTYFVQDKFYHSLQPRLSARVLLSDKLSLKAGYAYMNQYIHLLSSNNISLPTDLWVPVTKRIDPMNSHQLSAGIFYELTNIADLSVEGYYKSMNNLIEYKDGSSFMGSSTGWEDKVSMGRGWAYGVEFLAQKTFGKTTGWIGYTWSKSERLFNREGQELNNGNVFPAKYDRRHDISLVVSHKFSDRFDLSGTWVFSTGNTATLGLQNYQGVTVDQQYWYGQSSLEYINSRNNFRYPNYHRLDIGMNFHKQKKHGIRTWNFSIYNVYNQQNPFFVYPSTQYNYNYQTGESTTTKKLMQISLFTIIPSISYSYKF
ncbi:MAG: TonB-dependent receptor plug domain-containing protein, partial [Paludibacter sp.]